MNVFHYPKIKHTRTITPPQFTRYQSYKRYLQVEFSRVCVYCRQPDCTAPNLNYSVDHYRPNDKFKNLLVTYSNLFYCCGQCNSRKNAYWPLDEKKGPYVVNPCDYAMTNHLRFDSNTGQIEKKTSHGEHTIDLLQLNDPKLVTYRRLQLRLIKQTEAGLLECRNLQKQLKNRLKKQTITQQEFDEEMAELDSEITELQAIYDMHTGAVPTRPLPRIRAGVKP